MTAFRIMHVLTHNDAMRGGAIQALLLAREQIAAGQAVLVVVNSRPERLLDSTFRTWIDQGIQIVGVAQGASGISHPLEMVRFRRLVERFKPDVVHAHRDTALVFSWLALQGSDVPLVSQRGTTHTFRSGLIAHVHRSSKVERIIAVSNAVKEALVSFGVDDRKVEVVYGSFDVSRFDPESVDRSRVRQELGLSARQPLIVQVGEIQPKKGPENFVRVAAAVLRERPDCVFALVGRGSERKKTAALIEELGLSANVRLLGYRIDVPEIYAAADVALNCSIGNEGLTGSLREALAMKLPCVATRTDGNPEIVKHDKTGLLVEPGDDAAMARAVIELLSDPSRGARLGASGSRLVRESMDPIVRLHRTTAVYRSVVADPNEREGVIEHRASALGEIVIGGESSSSHATTEAVVAGGGRRRRSRQLESGSLARRGSTSLQLRNAASVVLLVLVALLPMLASVEIGRAGSAVNNLLDDGVLALNELEDMLQNLIDLRGGVLEVAMESSDGRATKVAELQRQLTALHRNADQLEQIDLEAISGAASEAEARQSISESERAIERYVKDASDSEVDPATLTRAAFEVSGVIDDAAGELNRMTSVVAYRARIVDSEVPEQLAVARYATLTLAVLAFLGLILAFLERRTRPVDLSESDLSP